MHIPRITFLRLSPDGYVEYSPDADGRYRSAGLPGLVCDPTRLWACLDDRRERHGLGAGIFAVEPMATPLGPPRQPNDHEEWTWMWRPFTPPIALQPTVITFVYT